MSFSIRGNAKINKAPTRSESRIIGQSIGVDFEQIDIDQFTQGLATELEHGKSDPETNVTNDDMKLTGKIAWAHLKEMPDYYSRLKIMEKGAE